MEAAGTLAPSLPSNDFIHESYKSGAVSQIKDGPEKKTAHPPDIHENEGACSGGVVKAQGDIGKVADHRNPSQEGQPTAVFFDSGLLFDDLLFVDAEKFPDALGIPGGSYAVYHQSAKPSSGSGCQQTNPGIKSAD